VDVAGMGDVLEGIVCGNFKRQSWSMFFISIL